MILSFAWTTPALLAGEKTVTRRDWKEQHARKFYRGQVVQAYDRSPRFKGRHVANILIEDPPRIESTADAPEADYIAEGFKHLTAIGALVDGHTPQELWQLWHDEPRQMYVVRFKLLEPRLVEPRGERI